MDRKTESWTKRWSTDRQRNGETDRDGQAYGEMGIYITPRWSGRQRDVEREIDRQTCRHLRKDGQMHRNGQRWAEMAREAGRQGGGGVVKKKTACGAGWADFFFWRRPPPLSSIWSVTRGGSAFRDSYNYLHGRPAAGAKK